MKNLSKLSLAMITVMGLALPMQAEDFYDMNGRLKSEPTESKPIEQEYVIIPGRPWSPACPVPVFNRVPAATDLPEPSKLNVPDGLGGGKDVQVNYYDLIEVKKEGGVIKLYLKGAPLTGSRYRLEDGYLIVQGNCGDETRFGPLADGQKIWVSFTRDGVYVTSIYSTAPVAPAAAPMPREVPAP
jgi:hypothetical protein